MDDYYRRSGQIPAFGDWDYSNQMPITQYFESARQAGLIRYSSSSGESDPYVHGGDLYTVDHYKNVKPSHNHANAPHPPPRKTKVVREKQRGPQVKESKRQVKKVCDYDVTDPPRKPPNHVASSAPISSHLDYYNNTITKLQHRDDVVPSRRPPKAVDEDLYKIPPELLHSAKRKKMPGLFSCLVPSACVS